MLVKSFIWIITVITVHALAHIAMRDLPDECI